MPRDNAHIESLFGVRILKTVKLDRLDESESPAAIALLLAGPSLAKKNDKPRMVLETADGFVVVGSTRAVYVPDQGNIVRKKLTEAAGDGRRRALMKSQHELARDSIQHSMDAIKKSRKEGEVHKSAKGQGGAWVHWTEPKESVEANEGKMDAHYAGRNLFNKIKRLKRRHKTDEALGRAVRDMMHSIIESPEYAQQRAADSLTLGQKAKQLFAHPVYGGIATRPGAYARIMTAMGREAHEGLCQEVNSFVESYVTKSLPIAVRSDARLASVLRVFERAVTKNDQYLTLEAAGRLFELCERQEESDQFYGWSMRMLEDGNAKDLIKEDILRRALLTFSMTEEEALAMNLPPEPVAMALIKGTMLNSPEVNAELVKLDVSDEKIGALLKACEGIQESQLVEYHRMATSKHDKMMKARRMHSADKTKHNKLRRMEWKHNKAENLRRQRMYRKHVARFTRHRPKAHESQGVVDVEFDESGSFQDVANAHKTKIAKSTLKMSDAGANIMGGMTKEEAREHLKKMNIKVKESVGTGVGVDVVYEVMQVNPAMADLLTDFLDECGFGEAWEAEYTDGKVLLHMPEAMADVVCRFMEGEIELDEVEAALGNPWAGKEGKLKFTRFTGSGCIKGNSTEEAPHDPHEANPPTSALESDADDEEDDGDDDEQEGGDGQEEDQTARSSTATEASDDEDDDEEDEDDAKDDEVEEGKDSGEEGEEEEKDEDDVKEGKEDDEDDDEDEDDEDSDDDDTEDEDEDDEDDEDDDEDEEDEEEGSKGKKKDVDEADKSDAAFEAWKKKVGQAVEAKAGMSADDLPDVNYRDMFEDGVSPSSAAAKAIKAARESKETKPANLTEDENRPHKLVKMAWQTGQKPEVVFTGKFAEMEDYAKKNSLMRVYNPGSTYGFYYVGKEGAENQYWIDPNGADTMGSQVGESVLVTFPRKMASTLKTLIHRAGGQGVTIPVTESSAGSEFLTASMPRALFTRVQPLLGSDFVHAEE